MDVRSTSQSLGDPGPVFLVFGIVVLGSLIALTFLVARTRRAQAEATAAPEPLSLLVAEPLARMTRRWRGFEVVALCALVAAGWWAELYPVALALVVAAFALDGYLKARRVTIELAKPNCGAELRATSLTVCTADGSHYRVRVSERAIARAREHAIPASSIAR